MMQPITCACEQCRAMCRNSTCLCSPDDVQRLIDAGFKDRLAAYVFPAGRAIGPAPASGGREHSTTRMGACTFFSEGCELHDAGLKPTEGQLAHHTRHWIEVRQAVMQQWTRADFRRLSTRI